MEIRARAARADQPEEYLPRMAPTPLLLLQGRRDRLVPSWATAALFSLAAEPKRLLEFPDEGHEFQTHRHRVVSEVCSWLEERLAPRRTAAETECLPILIPSPRLPAAPIPP